MSRVLGVVRFSYLQSTDANFPITLNKSLEARREMLFAPKRMAQRFELFEAICLPSLAAQNPDLFTGILLTSASMPQAHVDRLHALTEAVPHLHVVPAEPNLSHLAIREAVARHRPAEGMKLTFRLDDDDAISTDFTDRVAPYLQERYDGHCLTLLSGVGLCRLYGRVRAWDRRHPFVSAGLSYINRAEAPETVYDCGNHSTVTERFPTLVDASFPAFLQSTHGTNASSGHVPALAYLLPSQTMSLRQAQARYGAAFPFLRQSRFRFL